VLKKITDATVGPTEEISNQIQQAIAGAKEAGTLQITDDQVGSYVNFLRLTLEAAFQAKHRAGIERYWPVARVAVKVADQQGIDAIGAFRKVVVGQSGAKELDIVGPNDTWRGMRIDVEVHMNSVSSAYKLWAKKIEILLRSQDAWKIKAGLDRGEYSVGIEGQKVRIDPSMVSFVESIPDYVVEEPFEGGVLYLDTRMSKELLAEGYAKEIVELVKEARQDMKLEGDRVVEIELVANKELRAKLQPWTDMILRDSNALEMQFVTEPAKDAYVIEAGLGAETFLLGVRAAEM
jgi:isoleucyl-tRNA synthetase